MEAPRNGNVVLLASAVRAANNDTPDQVNRFGRGVIVFVDVTAVPGVDTVTFTLQGRNPIRAASWYTILASAALAATGQVVLKAFPGLTAAANLTVSDVLPYHWRVSVAHSAATNFTYSVSANIII